MDQILKRLIYTVLYDKETNTVYINDNIKVNQIKKIKEYIIKHGYKYNNLIIGRNYKGER